MECVSVHSTIERAKKNVDIFLPREWVSIITLARKKNPYIVIPLLHKDFIDVKALAKNKQNFKLFSNGEKMQWKKTKWLQMTRGSNDILVWYDVLSVPFTLNLGRKRKSRHNDESEQPDVHQYMQPSKGTTVGDQSPNQRRQT